MFLENASFFRMDDINLGYTFNKIGNWKGSMRVAFGVQNVFVITDYSGVDPEIPGVNGIDGSIWPAPAHLFAASECKLLKTNEP